jgi:chemotaxis-related protein WspD
VNPSLLQQRLAARCWKSIGVHGDKSCPELTVHLHCHNCPVFAEAGAGFLSRGTPASYLEEMTRLLAEPEQEDQGATVPLFVFRLGGEWLGLAASVLEEVTEWKKPHRIPHRTTRELLGLVNVRGELRLCASLHALLGAEPAAPGARATAQRRLIVIRRERDRWVFPVDEALGIHRFPEKEATAVPPTVGRASAVFTKSLFPHPDGGQLGWIDDELLFYNLNHRVL